MLMTATPHRGSEWLFRHLLHLVDPAIYPDPGFPIYSSMIAFAGAITGGGGLIKADGRVLRAGRNFVVAECEIFNEDGSLAAKALLTFGAAAGHSIRK